MRSNDSTNIIQAQRDHVFGFSSIVELTRYRAETQPSDKAYVFLKDGEVETSSLTYEALDRRARAIAVELKKYAVPGDRALLAYPPGLDFISAFLGSLYSGVIAVPVYPPGGPNDWPRFEKIMLDARATVVCTTSARFNGFNAASVVASPGVEGALSYLLTDTLDDDGADEEWWNPRVDKQDIAFLQYTSGSTGTPKGVIVSHGNLLHNEWMIRRGFQHSETTRVVGWLPLYHDMGLIGNVMQPLYLGVTSVLMAPAAFLVKPVRWLQAISHYRATTSGGPNFAYDLCVRRVTEEQASSLDLSSWTLAYNGSEVVRHGTLERFTEKFSPNGFRKSTFCCCYGMAESTLFVVSSEKFTDPVLRSIDADALQRHQVVEADDETENSVVVVGCGTAFELKVIIVNPETGLQCAPNSVGEIWVHGMSVAQGYWGNKRETEATFNACLADTGEGPFLRTGDLGFIQNGNLFVTGRLKDIIIIRGRNYYPHDIETAVQENHPALRVDSGAAFSIDIDGAEALVIVHEIDRGHSKMLDESEVVDTMRTAVMTQFGLPLHDVILLKHGKLAKTSSGKIRRRACREAYLDGDLEPLRFVTKKSRDTVTLTETHLADEG